MHSNDPEQSGEMLLDAEVHDDGYQVNDLQMSQDRTYFITAGKDKQAKVSTSPPWSPFMISRILIATLASNLPRLGDPQDLQS
jgi:hypothetical protein